MSAERLSALDASFLAVESPRSPMHVGWVARLRPAGARAAPELRRALRAHRRAARRARRATASGSPTCRSALHEPGMGRRPGLRPRRAPARAPPAATSTRSSTPSSRRRWRATGRCGRCGSPTALPDGRIALVGKAHHCMVDGTAVVELGNLLLDREPDARDEPAREPLVARAGARRPASGSCAPSPTAPPTARRSRWPRCGSRLAARLRASRPSRAAARARSRTRVLPPAPGSPLNRPGSPRRHHVRVTRPLGELRERPPALPRDAQRRGARRLRRGAAALRRAPRRDAAAR